MNNPTSTPRLLEWADEPASSPWPLPSTGTAWPIEKLDAELLAEVLASRGYTRDAATPSLARNGAACPTAVLATLLDELAALVAVSVDGYVDDVHSDELEDFSARAADPSLSADERARFATQAQQARAMIGTTVALRASLRATATEMREHLEAAAALAARVAAHLPVDPVLEARELASAWLALHDADDRIKRPDLVRAYILAGSPGDLTAEALRILAAHRWGPTRRLRGEDYYRPSLAFEIATGPDLERIAALIGVPLEALDALVRAHRA